jgi:primary-amine oxidase
MRALYFIEEEVGMKYIKQFALMIVLSLSMLVTARAESPHPFDDLSADEVKALIEIVRGSGKFSSEVRFPVMRAQEPIKADWIAGRVGSDRVAYCALFDPAKALLSEVLINITQAKILSVVDLPNIKPPVLLEEYSRARTIIRADPRWQAAVRKRGVNDLGDVFVDMWAPGLMSAEESRPGQRLLRGLTYMNKNARNFYSRPLEGVVATVDLVRGVVTSVWDLDVAPVAKGYRELSEKDNQPIDPPLKPLITEQPEGSSIEINGQEISWARWKFRYAMDPLQGLKLYHVRFNEAGKERSILYKIALAEMLVPYGGAGKNWSFRNAFDVGEYGLGKTLHPLIAGKDVPNYAQLLDTVVPDDLGSEPVTIKGVAVYERESGIMWKHRNSENGDTDIRGARQLVITFMTTVGNYDYGINYIFDLDGTIHVEAQLTGILLARGSVIEKNACGDGCLPLMEANVLAPVHQHFFNFRIDLDIDSGQNYAAEVNVAAQAKGKNNPDGNIFSATNTVLSSELKAVRDLNAASARKWKVYNPDSRNALNHPRGYALVAGETAFPYLDPSSTIRKRAGFINHPIWFTAYNDQEMSAAASYPTTAPIGQGLPSYVRDNQSLTGTDVVLWYTFGVTHIPRPEEWPIMNVHHTGFTLMPVNFFDQNPTMRLPE